MIVNVIDAIMGRGKTSAMINHINNSDDDIKYLYITPYLKEVDRIIEMCPRKRFRQPEKYGSKLRGIKDLFSKGENIVSTHVLFSMFDEEIIDLAYNYNYVLVMDEVADVITPLEISKYDLETILEKYTEIVDGHLLKWTAKDYEGDFEKYKRLCDLDSIGVYSDTAMLWLFPISTFRAFREIYLLTYLFEAQTQKYYFDLYGIEYRYLYVEGNTQENYNITTTEVEYEVPDFSKLIHICEVEKLNHVGDMNTALSATWYKRNKNNILMGTLKNNLNNYFKNYTKTRTGLNLWTTFKDAQKALSGKGYAKGFVEINVRATNYYKDRTALAYMVNRYFNPLVKNFFTNHGIEVNEDLFAVSEMLQWIWRSAIREGGEIWIYIPSKRMRDLLESWMDNVGGSKKNDTKLQPR